MPIVLKRMAMEEDCCTPIQISLPIEIWAPLYGIIPAVIAGTLIPTYYGLVYFKEVERESIEL
jgi:hypothetical protein